MTCSFLRNYKKLQKFEIKILLFGISPCKNVKYRQDVINCISHRYVKGRIERRIDTN